MSNLVDKLTGWVKGQGPKQEKRSTSWGWTTSLAVGAVAMLAVGFMYWRSWKQGRRLAKLEHERDLTEQTKAKAALAAETAATNKKIQLNELEAIRAKNRIKRLDEDLGKITDETIETREKIDMLKNWRDVDRYLDGNDDEPPRPSAA